MLNEYVADALTGADQDQADAFLNRRAPWYYWLRYWAYVALVRLRPRRSPETWAVLGLPAGRPAFMLES